MWTCKVSINGKNAAMGSRTLKHNVNLFGFPLSYVRNSSFMIVNISGVIVGDEKNKKEFFRSWKDSGRLFDLELNNDFFIATIGEPYQIAKEIYRKELIHLSPALIDEKGVETIHIASFDKRHINNLIKTLERNYETKLHFIKQEKVKSISFMRENPNLTVKQKKAIQLAIKNEYYSVPRKTSVEKLAEISGLAFSTFQVHLRKAEEKLIPYFFEQ